MGRIGYHCSHEQYSPSELLALAKEAEKAGFVCAMCSDHFYPWDTTQGQSGFAWSWLGAALGATSLDFGVVNAPGQRYHPAIIAQAAATLSDLFPTRFWMALGTGQYLNEHITGEKWIHKSARQERLLECVAVIRALFSGETVNHNLDGTNGHITVRETKLFSLPPKSPPIIGAAVSLETARWVGSWADGLITVVKPYDELKQVVQAFRDSGGAGKPMFLQAQTSFARTHDLAVNEAFTQWKTPALESTILTEIERPEDFEREARSLTPQDLEKKFRISADIEQHKAWLSEYFDLGFDTVYLHQVGRNQKEFMDTFGSKVLPEFTKNS